MASEAVQKDFQEVKPPEGEWHRTPENEEIIGRVVSKVWGIDEDNVMVAHHICFRDRQRQKVEIASAESLIFDPFVLETLFGDGWMDRAISLVLHHPHQRLGAMKELMQRAGVWN